MKIAPYSKKLYRDFFKLFSDYYNELECDEDIEQLLTDYVLPDCAAELLRIDLALEGGEAVGFVIYQTDGIENDWNFKEGWGDIRELFVAKNRRKSGIGRALLQNAEKNLNAKNIYLLPEEGAEGFFIKCGYADGGDYNSELDCKVFEKRIKG